MPRGAGRAGMGDSDEFERAGTRLECITQEVDRSPEGRLFFSIRGAVAEFEKAKIRERTARGRQEKAEQGKVVLPRNLPCWLRSDDGGATVHLDEEHWAPIVRRAFVLFQQGAKLWDIARQFEQEGIAPPGAGRYWRSGTIHDWLRSPAAKGTYQQFVTETVPSRTAGKTSRKRREPEPWATVEVPALVDEVTWAAVQERLQRNKAFSNRNAKRVYLLSGLVRCDRCGARLAGAYSNGYRYYRCTHRATRYGDGPIPPEARCDARWTPAGWLEDAVWDRVAGLFRDPERLRAELEQRQQEGSPTRAAAEKDLSGLRARLTEIPREQDRLLGAFAKGHVPEDALARQMDSLQKERLAAQARAADLERELAALALSEKQQADVVEYAASIAAGLDSLDDEGRKQFLQDMVREVRVDGRRVTISTILHGGPGGGGSGGEGFIALRPVHQHGTVGKALGPVGRKLARRQGQDAGRQVADGNPGQQEKPGVVDDEVQVGLALFRGPADEGVAWCRLPGGGAEPEDAQQDAVAVDKIAHLGAGQRRVAEVMVVRDEVVPMARGGGAVHGVERKLGDVTARAV